MRLNFIRGIRFSLALVVFVLATTTFSTTVDESIPRDSTVSIVNADGRHLQNEQKNIVEVLNSNPNSFSQLVDFVELANLVDTLILNEGITVLAPTNDAFLLLASVAPGFLENLQTQEWSLHLEDLVLYHVIPGAKIPSSAISDGVEATSFYGDVLTFTVNDEGIFVNYVEEFVDGEILSFGSKVIEPDIEASNGIIHAIDNVLAPYWVGLNIVDVANAFPYHTTLVQSLVTNELVDSLIADGPFTLFAPTNEAFEKFLEDQDDSVDLETILLYHVVPGIYAGPAFDDIIFDLGSLTTLQGEDIQFGVDLSASIPTVNGDSFAALALDLLANNGVVHSIEQVLIPPSIAPASTGDGDTIFDVAVADSDTFSSFVNFVETADFKSALTDISGITVFAPTNVAFDLLSNESPQVVENLQSEEWIFHLQDLLGYHIIPDVVPSKQIEDGLISESVIGQEVAFSINDNGGIFVNIGSEVVVPDLKADNGIMHGIDEVLLPTWVDNNVVDIVTGNSDFATLTNALIEADLVNFLSEDGPFTVFAPTNEAFDEFLDGESIDSLDFDSLTNVLTRHVVPGIFSIESEAADGTLTLTTTSGESLSANFEKFSVDNANIAEDFFGLSNNGIVYAIDKVLSDETFSPTGSPSTGSPVDPGTAAPVDPVDEIVPPTEAPKATIGNLILGPTPAVYNSGDAILPTPAELKYVAQNLKRPTQGNRLSGL